MTTLKRKIKYAWWAINGYLGPKQRGPISQKATVLITYYNPLRMQHIDAQLRNLFKCTFVEKIVLSNHNPDIRIEDRVRLRDPRLVFINQTVRQGCGYRWGIAAGLDADYVIVIDDDILLFPGQLAQLFHELVRQPAIPHGFTGMLHLPNDVFEYHEREERVVDYLCEVYAVTRHHLQRFQALAHSLNHDETVAHMIASAADFMVISQTGVGKPKIHNAGRLLRCASFNQAGVAVHKESDFAVNMTGVSQALTRVLAAG